jgi:hypothetical protein
LARARPLALIVVVALAACDGKAKCNAALVAASKAVWAFKPVDKAVNEAWSTSVDLEKVLDQSAYQTTAQLEGNCHEIDRALAHPENVETELLHVSAQSFRTEVVEIESDPTEPLDPPVLAQLQRDRAPFDAALATYAKGLPGADTLTSHPPNAADQRHLKLLGASWCTLEASFHAALANRLDHIKAEQVKNKSDIAKYGDQAKAEAAEWTAAQDFGRAIDKPGERPALVVPANLDADPDFAGARAAVAAANAACK